MSFDVNSAVDATLQILKNTGASPSELKAFFNLLAQKTDPALPPWSTLRHFKIQDVETASVGSGIAVIFKENGVFFSLMGVVGSHYPQASQEPHFCIPGGFINLTNTKGSLKIAPSDQPEDARIGGARETEEEFKNPDGSPLLAIDPERLKLMDTKTIAKRNGDKTVVMGLMLELTPEEISLIKTYCQKMNSDPDFKAQVSHHTINPGSGKPEIADVKIVSLQDILNGQARLLHSDQMSLFKKIQRYYASLDALKASWLAEMQKPVNE